MREKRGSNAGTGSCNLLALSVLILLAALTCLYPVRQAGAEAGQPGRAGVAGEQSLPAASELVGTGSNVSVPDIAVPETESKDEEQDAVIIAYQQHRLAFSTRKKKIRDEVEQERVDLRKKIAELEEQIEQGKKELERRRQNQKVAIPIELAEQLDTVRGKIVKWRGIHGLLPYINGGLAAFLAPWLLVFGEYAALALYVFLPITLINLLIFLFFRHREVYRRNKKRLIIILVTVMVASAVSAFAAPVDKRLQVETELRYAVDMLTLTGNRKAIRILEAKAGDTLTLPDGLASGDSELAVYQTVRVNSPENFFTLAALYAAEQQPGKAIEALSAIAENRGLDGKPNAAILVGTVHYLAEHGYTDVAGSAVSNHIASIDNVEVLLDLTRYLKEYGMQKSASLALETAIKKAGDTTNLVALANYNYKNGKAESGGKLLAKALKKARKLADVILVAESCQQHHEDKVFDLIPAKMKKLKGAVGDYLQLAKIFSQQGKNDQVGILLERAVGTVNDPHELKKVTEVVIELGQDGLMDGVRKRLLAIFGPDLQQNFTSKRYKKSLAGALDFVDFLLANGRKEDAGLLFTDIFDKVRKNKKVSVAYLEEMIELSRQALERDLKTQAENIAFRLTMSVRPRRTIFKKYFIFKDTGLNSAQGLPDDELLSIPIYQGLIDEDIDQLSKAETVYMQSVLFSLLSINDSYGNKIPRILNDYYLLGRLWQRENRTEALTSLDRVYTILESKILDSMKDQLRAKLLKEERDRLVQLSGQREQQLAEIARVKENFEKRRQELERRRRELTDKAWHKLDLQKKALTVLMARTVSKVLATLVFLLAIMALVIGCFRLAWRYSQRMREHRTYAFFSRFLELNGWLRIFSVIGFPSGFTLVLVSQFFQIFQKIHEISLQRVPVASYNIVPGKTVNKVQKKEAA